MRAEVAPDISTAAGGLVWRGLPTFLLKNPFLCKAFFMGTGKGVAFAAANIFLVLLRLAALACLHTVWRNWLRRPVLTPRSAPCRQQGGPPPCLTVLVEPHSACKRNCSWLVFAPRLT